MNETQLIQESPGSQRDEAFKALVDQYVGLVYSACCRQLKDRHLAEDATQAVFILLNQKEGALPSTHLSGWLLTTSRYACANIRRSQQRRQRREQVVAMKPITAAEIPDSDLLDLLDEALRHLKAADREALVLSYLQEQPISDVAEQLGVSEGAARKRVSRGIEKLRQYFSRRGMNAASAGLGVLLTEQVRGATLTPAARHAMTQGIVQVCRAGPHSAATSIAIAKGTKTMMILTKLKIAAAFAIVIVTIGATGWVVSRVMADNQAPALIADPANTPPALPPIADAPATGPAATQPATDLSTPDKTFAAIVAALKAGNRQQLYECLAVDPTRQPSLMDRILDWNLASNRMVIAARQAYGPKAAALTQGKMTLDTVMEMMAAVGSSGGGQRTVTNDAVYLSVRVPPAILNVLPADAQQVISQWSGAPIRFKKEGNQWKFDIDHSMRVEMHAGAATPKEEMEKDAAVLQELTEGTNQVTADITAGKLPTVEDTADALKRVRRQVLVHNGLSQLDFMVLPAKSSGTPDNR